MRLQHDPIGRHLANAIDLFHLCREEVIANADDADEEVLARCQERILD